MRTRTLAALASLSILWACGRNPEAAPVRSEPEGEPEITIRKPEPKSIEVTAEAVQIVGPYRVEWICADVRVEITGAEPFTLMADEHGRIRIPLYKVWALSGRPSGTITVGVAVRTETQEARAALELSREESDTLLLAYRQHLQAGAGKGLEESRFPDVEAAALALLDLSPLDSDALYLLAKARDAKGNALGAVLAYREYLIGKDKTADRAREAKARAIARSKDLSEPLQVPNAALDFVLASVECAQEQKWGEAYDACRMAQEVAPWWEEPYYRAAVIQAHAWMEGTCKGEIVLEDFDLYFSFGRATEEARNLRSLYEKVKAVKKDNDDLAKTWEEVKDLYDLNRPALDVIREGMQEDR